MSEPSEAAVEAAEQFAICATKSWEADENAINLNEVLGRPGEVLRAGKP